MGVTFQLQFVIKDVTASKKGSPLDWYEHKISKGSDKAAGWGQITQLRQLVLCVVQILLLLLLV